MFRLFQRIARSGPGLLPRHALSAGSLFHAAWRLRLNDDAGNRRLRLPISDYVDSPVEDFVDRLQDAMYSFMTFIWGPI